MVKLPRDLKEFIELMNSNGVEYVVVGGHAVAYHGYPRYTGDFDFFIRPSQENAKRVIAVLQAFGFADVADLDSLLTAPDKVIQLGRPPNRIDILSGISGVSFEKAHATSVVADLAGLTVPMIGLEALIENKAAAGRPKDQADVLQLESIRRRPKK
jgi:predicted nucleotidyltransferase